MKLMSKCVFWIKLVIPYKYVYFTFIRRGGHRRTNSFHTTKNCIGSFWSKELHLGSDLQKNCIRSLIYCSGPGHRIGTLLYPCVGQNAPKSMRIKGTCQGVICTCQNFFSSLTWLKESLFRVSSRYLQKVITSQGCQWEQCEALRFYQSLFLRYEIEKGTESGLVGPRNQFFRILCSELIFRKLNESKVSNTGSVHHTLPADIQLTGIQLYWVKMSTKDTSFHSFFAFFSLLEKTETLDKKGDQNREEKKVPSGTWGPGYPKVDPFGNIATVRSLFWVSICSSAACFPDSGR